jgi:hypothetical protein
VALDRGQDLSPVYAVEPIVGFFFVNRHLPNFLRTRTQLPDTGNNARILAAGIKPRIAPLVAYLYGFSMSRVPNCMSYNAERAQKLLRDTDFVYPVGLGRSHFATVGRSHLSPLGDPKWRRMP